MRIVAEPGMKTACSVGSSNQKIAAVTFALRMADRYITARDEAAGMTAAGVADCC